MKDNNSIESMISEVSHLITGNRILDVGTGFGTVVNKLMNRPGMKIYTVDPEAWSFDSLNSMHKDHIKSGRLNLVRSRIEDVDLGKETFDTSIAIASLHHLKDPVAGLRKMEELTRGSVIVTDWNESSAGIHNPHSREDLGDKERSLKKYANESGYSISDHKYWYVLHKKIEK